MHPRRAFTFMGTVSLVAALALLAGCAQEERSLPGFFDTDPGEKIASVLDGRDALVFIGALHDRGVGGGAGGARYRSLSLYFSRAEPLQVASAGALEEKTSFRTSGWRLRPYLLPPGTYSVRALAWEEPAADGVRRRVIEVTPYEPGSGAPGLFAFTIAGGEVRNLGFLASRADPDDVGGLYLRIEDNGRDVETYLRRHYPAPVAERLLARLETRLPTVPPHTP